MLRLRISAAALLVAVGCARETPSARAPSAGLRPWVTPPGYGWPPRSIEKEDRMHPSERALATQQAAPEYRAKPCGNSDHAGRALTP